MRGFIAFLLSARDNEKANIPLCLYGLSREPRVIHFVCRRMGFKVCLEKYLKV